MVTVDPKTRKTLADFQGAMRALAEATRKDESQILTLQGKALAARMVAYTPTPRQVAEGNVATYGKKVIGRYFQRAAHPLIAAFWNAQPVKDAIRENDAAKAQAVLQRILGNPSIRVEPWDISLVYRQMNRRGQVPKRSGDKNRFTIATPQWKSDLKTAQSSVLKAKGGWAQGWQVLGGKPPAQVARHAGEGEFRDGRKKTSPYILFVNRSAWAGRSDEAKRITLAAMSGQIRAMEAQLKKNQEKRLQAAAKKLR